MGYIVPEMDTAVVLVFLFVVFFKLQQSPGSVTVKVVQYILRLNSKVDKDKRG